jgi:hypothetical protein
MVVVLVEEEDNTPVAGGVFNGETPLAVAVEWMERAMREHGIGAKTSVGYGFLYELQAAVPRDRDSFCNQKIHIRPDFLHR